MAFYGVVGDVKLGPQGEVDYKLLKKTIMKELEQFANLPLSTSSNDIVNSFCGKYVSNGLNLYYIVPETTIWADQIKKNPNVAVSYMSRQIQGKARILGTPYEPKYNWIIEKYKKRHLHYIDVMKNIPHTIVIEVIPTYISIFEVTKEHPLEWTVVHLDLVNEKAFWTCAWDSPMMTQKKKND